MDVDGVLVRGAKPLPGAIDALAALRRRGSILLLSNNSTASRDAAAAKLRSLGFAVSVEDIIPSSFVAARYLLETHGAVTVWPVGEIGLRAELELAGHRIAQRPEDAQWVVAGMDRYIDYAGLDRALQALLHGARFLATNRDPTFPADGALHPGAGAIIGALEGAGFPPEAVIGKPSPVAFHVAIERMGIDPERILMVGDRLETDIEGGQRAGLDTALVLTGVTTHKILERSTLRPTWVAADLVVLARGDVKPGGSPQSAHSV